MEQVADDLFLCFRLPMEPSRNPNPNPENKYQSQTLLKGRYTYMRLTAVCSTLYGRFRRTNTCRLLGSLVGGRPKCKMPGLEPVDSVRAKGDTLITR